MEAENILRSGVWMLCPAIVGDNFPVSETMIRVVIEQLVDFVTGGLRKALDSAREAAAGMDVRIGGGPNTIRQYLREGLIDELHIAIAPVLLGRGEPLFQGIDLRALGYECVEFVASEKATHVVLRRQGHKDA